MQHAPGLERAVERAEQEIFRLRSQFLCGPQFFGPASDDALATVNVEPAPEFVAWAASDCV
jgi:hypothetical protein